MEYYELQYERNFGIKASTKIFTAPYLIELNWAFLDNPSSNRGPFCFAFHMFRVRVGFRVRFRVGFRVRVGVQG